MLQALLFGLTFLFYVMLGVHETVARVAGLKLCCFSEPGLVVALAVGACGLLTGLWCSVFAQSSADIPRTRRRHCLVWTSLTGSGVLLMLVAAVASAAYARVIWRDGVLDAARAAFEAIANWSYHDLLAIAPLIAAPCGLVASASMKRHRMLEQALACGVVLIAVMLVAATANVLVVLLEFTGAITRESLLRLIADSLAEGIVTILTPGAVASAALIGASGCGRVFAVQNHLRESNR